MRSLLLISAVLLFEFGEERIPCHRFDPRTEISSSRNRLFNSEMFRVLCPLRFEISLGLQTKAASPPARWTRSSRTAIFVGNRPNRPSDEVPDIGAGEKVLFQSLDRVEDRPERPEGKPCPALSNPLLRSTQQLSSRGQWQKLTSLPEAFKRSPFQDQGRMDPDKIRSKRESRGQGSEGKKERLSREARS